MNAGTTALLSLTLTLRVTGVSPAIVYLRAVDAAISLPCWSKIVSSTSLPLATFTEVSFTESALAFAFTVTSVVTGVSIPSNVTSNLAVPSSSATISPFW